MLTPLERRVRFLHLNAGLRKAEIARLLGLRPQNVHTLLKRAKAKVERLWAQRAALERDLKPFDNPEPTTRWHGAIQWGGKHSI